MGLPPWETSSSQLFVLITGSNSGLGYCICERLITEFLTNPSRDTNSHLVLTVTTRSKKKTRDTIVRLNKHARSAASKTAVLNGEEWRDIVRRIHILGTEVDLCDIRGVYEAATRIQNTGVGDGNSLQNIILPRLDVLIMNAGMSGYLGFNYFLATKDILTNLKQSVTWPGFLRTNSGAKAKPQRLLKAANGHTVPSGEDTKALINGSGSKETDQPVLGEIFLANVFGHYLLAHALMPLLSTGNNRVSGDKARLIWLSSLDALNNEFNAEDIQGLTVKDAYKSSKRLTDLLALTSRLPGVQKVNASFFSCETPVVETVGTPRKSKRIVANGDGHANGGTDVKTQRPEMYDTHPGVCVTDIVSTALWQRILWMMSLYFARWLGSIWHPISPQKGACAIAWTSLAEQRVLDGLEGPEGTKKGKWGSCTDWWGEERVRRTEVEGWGWDGSVQAQVVGEERKGRKYGAVALTEESREDFEVLGARVWGEMEALRREWEDRLGLGAGK